MSDRVSVTVLGADGRTVVETTRGRVLRDVLRESGCSPYTRLTERANCGGRGLCVTCGVRVREGSAPPAHWHDRLADWAGYPRLSCQLTVEEDTVAEIPDKRVWGGRE